jgi:hypothetical protein
MKKIILCILLSCQNLPFAFALVEVVGKGFTGDPMRTKEFGRS